MTPAGARVALAALGMGAADAAKMFGRTERCVFYWLTPEGDGPPEHIALTLSAMVRGEITKTQARSYARRLGRTRRDGDRYTKGR